MEQVQKATLPTKPTWPHGHLQHVLHVPTSQTRRMAVRVCKLAWETQKVKIACALILLPCILSESESWSIAQLKRHMPETCPVMFFRFVGKGAISSQASLAAGIRCRDNTPPPKKEEEQKQKETVRNKKVKELIAERSASNIKAKAATARQTGGRTEWVRNTKRVTSWVHSKLFESTACFSWLTSDIGQASHHRSMQPGKLHRSHVLGNSKGKSKGTHPLLICFPSGQPIPSSRKRTNSPCTRFRR